MHLKQFVSSFALAMILWIAVSPPTEASSLGNPNFNNLFVFGDSLSDTGNVAIATAPSFQGVPFGGLLPSLAYENGRFSNGEVWVEFLANELQLSVDPILGGGTNFAFGGARTGPTSAIPPSLLDQLEAYFDTTGGTADFGSLYVVWGGSNDTRDAAAQKLAGNDTGATATVTTATQNIAFILDNLAAAGAVHFLVPNIPDLGLTPEALRGPSGLDVASTAVSVEFNTLLDGVISAAAANHPGARFIPVDAFQRITDIAASPSTFGLSNTSDPCIDVASVCANPEEYLFYDGIHPTSAGHELAAEMALIALCPAPTDKLRINGLNGGMDGNVDVGLGVPIVVSIDSTPGPTNQKYFLYAWPSSGLHEVALAIRGEVVGCLSGATPIEPGIGMQPAFCVRGSGIPAIVCGNARDVRGPSFLPISVRSGGVANPISLVLQAVIQNPNACNSLGFSTTNSIQLNVQ